MMSLDDILQMNDSALSELSATQLQALIDQLASSDKSLQGNNSLTLPLESQANNGTDVDVHGVLWESFPAYRASHLLQLYLQPLLVVLGVVGNLLAFITFVKRGRRKKSVDLYLCILAVVDSLVLVLGPLRSWLETLTGISLLDDFELGCKAVNTLLFTCTFVSVWLIVAFTYDRFIAVRRPLKARQTCVVSRARKVTGVIFLAALGVNGHFLFTVTVWGDEAAGQSKVCQPGPRFRVFLIKIWPFIDAFVYSIIPMAFVALLNLSTACRTTAANRRERILSVPGKDSGRAVRKVAAMLLVVSVAFVVCTLPVSALMVWQAFNGNDSADADTVESRVWKHLLRTVAELLMYIHHAGNFYLYCASSSYFRGHFKHSMCGRQRKTSSSTIQYQVSGRSLSSASCHPDSTYIPLRRFSSNPNPRI